MNYTTLRKAAKELQMPEHFLRARCRANSIPYIRSGNRYMINPEQVRAHLLNEAAAVVSSGKAQSEAD